MKLYQELIYLAKAYRATSDEFDRRLAELTDEERANRGVTRIVAEMEAEFCAKYHCTGEDINQAQALLYGTK